MFYKEPALPILNHYKTLINVCHWYKENDDIIHSNNMEVRYFENEILHVNLTQSVGVYVAIYLNLYPYIQYLYLSQEVHMLFIFLEQHNYGNSLAIAFTGFNKQKYINMYVFNSMLQGCTYQSTPQFWTLKNNIHRHFSL